MNRTVVTVIGFLLFLSGMYSLVVSLVGAKVSYLLWLDYFGQLGSFLIKLLMIMVGMIMIYLSRTNWREEMEEDQSA